MSPFWTDPYWRINQPGPRRQSDGLSSTTPPAQSLLPPVTTPCSLQGGGGAAARTAEREARREERHEEGLSIGSDPMSNYLDSNGFEVQPATADRIFRYPSKVNEALAAQLSDEADRLARHRAKWAERHLP